MHQSDWSTINLIILEFYHVMCG